MTVDHSYYKVSNQGQDIYKDVFLTQLSFYKTLGYKNITIHANIDVGCWAWGRYGFEFRDWYGINSTYKFDKKFKTNDADSYFIKGKLFIDCVEEYCQANKIPLKKFQDYIVKAKLDWNGNFDLNNNIQLEKGISYAKKPKKPKP